MCTESVNSFESTHEPSSRNLYWILLVSFVVHMVLIWQFELVDFRSPPTAARVSTSLRVTHASEDKATQNSPVASEKSDAQKNEIIDYSSTPRAENTQESVTTTGQSSFSQPKSDPSSEPNRVEIAEQTTSFDEAKTPTSSLPPSSTIMTAKATPASLPSSSHPELGETDQEGASESLLDSMNSRRQQSNDGIFLAPIFDGPIPVVVTPADAKRKRWRGKVLLRGMINNQGHMEGIYVYKTSGYAVLDQAALKQALTWRYKAAVVDGKATSHHVEIPVVFQ